MLPDNEPLTSRFVPFQIEFQMIATTAFQLRAYVALTQRKQDDHLEDLLSVLYHFSDIMLAEEAPKNVNS